MKTIDGNATHRHRWRRIGAHTLHAGGKKRAPLREVRHVSACECGEVRVHIRHHVVFVHDDEHAVAVTQQTKRIPGQTAVALVRKKKNEYTKEPDPRPGHSGTVLVRHVKAADALP